MHRVNYAEMKVWADELGNTVRKFIPAGSYESSHGVDKMGGEAKEVFTGTATVRVQVPGQQPRNVPITFQFPDDVTNEQFAWEAFDKYTDETLKDMQAKANVIPAHGMPKIVGPNGKPFFGPDGKPIGG